MPRNLKCLTLISAVAVVAACRAQSLPEYLALRKKFGISAAAGAPALDTVVGSRTLELSGVVVGSISRKGETILMLANGDDRTDELHAKSVPDWLVGHGIVARIIVSAKRELKDEVQVYVLGIARDSDVALAEARAREAEANEATRRAAKPVYSPPKGNRARRLWSLPMSQVTPIYAAYIRKINHRLTPEEAMNIARALIGFSVRYGVDARLIIAMVVEESDFNPHETSRAGAMGLGQLMPGTARDFGISNAYDTTANLYGTVREIRNDLDRYRNHAGSGYESLRLALAAYNAGIGAVARAGGVPNYRETQTYIKRVIRLYAKLCGLRE